VLLRKPQAANGLTIDTKEEIEMMTTAESRKLKPGDRVGYLHDPEEPPIDYGTVLANNKHAVQIQWEDIENSGCENGIGWIDHDDAKALSRE
jgi:hypothetical protein